MSHRPESALELAVVGLDAVVPYCSLWCHAAGTRSSSSFGYTDARSVITSAGSGSGQRFMSERPRFGLGRSDGQRGDRSAAALWLLDDIADFYRVLGFRPTYRQVRPNPYLALQWEDLHLDFFEMPDFVPENSYG
jgi:hypothetical protein